MPSKNSIQRIISSALDRMFTIVGFDGFDPEFAKRDNWYLQRSWTEEQENEFKAWLINECRTKLRMRKKAAEFEASVFILSWGWKIEPSSRYIDKNSNNEKHQVNASI